MTPTGALCFSVRYSVHSNSLNVRVMKAKGLACVGWQRNTSNPYVKTYLLPDLLRTSKRRTGYKIGTTAPVWNETIRYDMGREDVQKKTLRVSVWNYDKNERNDFLGEVLVSVL